MGDGDTVHKKEGVGVPENKYQSTKRPGGGGGGGKKKESKNKHL